MISAIAQLGFMQVPVPSCLELPAQVAQSLGQRLPFAAGEGMGHIRRENQAN